jgi:tRNA threonylcarbamoyladenosine biosynthesis protein TsaB
MNVLVIDTAQQECSVGLYDEQKLDLISWQWCNDTGSEVLERISQILSKHSLKLTDINYIIVNQGPGSYTGVRVGITVANTLAWSLNTKIIGQGFPQGFKLTGENVQQILSKKKFFDHFPTPIY